LQAIKRPGFTKKHPEDYCICADNKDFLEKECGIRFAPTAVAEQFAVERSEWHDAFGFHGFFNFAKVLNDEEIKNFLSKSPSLTFKNIDVYELIDYLISHGRNSMAKILFSRVRFLWKQRRRYFHALCRSKY
jgi:hypothetical protein